MSDYAVVAGYFILVFAVAFLVSRKRKQAQSGASTEYFLGGRTLGWFAIGASLFASNIGSEHLVGLAGAGAKGDFPAVQFELLAAFILLLLGWLFVPFYLRTGVFTMPEFLEKRYDSWSRSYLSWVSILSYVLTKISVTIAAGGIIFTAFLGIDFWTGAIVVVVATGLYTVLGGLKAVIYTDTIQMFIFLAGALALTFYGLQAVGGGRKSKYSLVQMLCNYGDQSAIPIFHGRAFYWGHQFWVFGIGVPINLLCSVSCRPKVWLRRGAARSLPAI